MKAGGGGGKGSGAAEARARGTAHGRRAVTLRAVRGITTSSRQAGSDLCLLIC
jgi:hypothetical protein